MSNHIRAVRETARGVRARYWLLNTLEKLKVGNFPDEKNTCRTTIAALTDRLLEHEYEKQRAFMRADSQ
jgi:hypothetical protein